MHATKNSASNAARVVGTPTRDAVKAKSDLAVPRSGDEHSKLLELQSSISDAFDLDKPQSKCQSAMTELVGLAIRPGPTGHNARTALLDVYTQDIGHEKRQAILNTAQEISEHFGRTGGTVDLSVTVAFMAACAPLPPLGENGPGHVDANLAHVARNLPLELQREPDLLVANRVITSTELLAAGANLENLNVWDRPVSMATPSVATKAFEALGHQALRQLKSGAVWVPGSAGHHIAVVAEPVSDGIRFHVIARPGDEQAHDVAKALKGLSFGGPCIVSRYEVEHPHLALEHLNDNVEDHRGAGGVIQEHADNWKSLNPEDQRALILASQAKLFEAVAASASQGSAQVPTGTHEVALPVPPARPKSLEDNFNTQGLTVRSGQVHSAFDAFAEIFSLKDAMLLAPDNPQLMTSYLTTFHAQNDVPNKANFLRPALAFADGFNEDKAPLLFKNVDPSGPLASISKTLHGVGSGRKIIELMVKHQQTLLQECRDAKDLSQLKKKLEEVVEVQAMLLGGINAAIADLEKFESEDLTSLNPNVAAQAKAQAKDLLAVSKRYRECLTGENSAEGNVYADFVAFAKQATTFGPSLEPAQAMFRGMGSKPRTEPAPADSPQPSVPDTSVKLPGHLDVPGAVQAQAATTAETSAPTPAEFRALASAAGLGKSWDGKKVENVFSELTAVMESRSEFSATGRPSATDPYLSRVFDAKLNSLPKPASSLRKAMIEVNKVQAKLAKSPIWEQSYVGTQNSPLGRGGANLLALPHQGPLVLREPLEQAAKAAEAFKAAGNGPTAARARERAMAKFSRELVNAKEYVEGQLKRMDEGIALLKEIEASPKAGRRAKADAFEMRKAEEALQKEWSTGLAQQVVKFASAAAENPVAAIAALTA